MIKNDFSAHAAMAARADALALERARWAAVLARPANPRQARRKPAARADIGSMFVALFAGAVIPAALFAAVSFGIISR